MSEYTEAVKTNMKDREAVSTGACPGCKVCQEAFNYCCERSFQAAYDAGDICNKGNFGKLPCDCCGSSLGGDRYSGHYILPDDKGRIVGQPIEHMSICTDCLIYLANGDEPENWEG